LCCVALVGWLGNSIRTEQYDIVFHVGAHLAVLRRYRLRRPHPGNHSTHQSTGEIRK